jgi:ABC-type transporter Mla subunit MlaD
MSLFKAGVIGIVLLVIFTYLGFTKFANPLASPYEVHAVFPSANGLVPDSLVRIAGINVGKVTGISPLTGANKGAADVTMSIDDAGLPLHSDATFTIRPRIFLEGNFFIDVRPGSPSTPTVGSGHTFNLQQGADPVQLDQILTGLQGDTRRNLQVLLTELGTAFNKSDVSFNRSIPYWLPAYEYSAIVAHDALGIQPHDLSNYIAAQATVSQATDQSPQIQNLITDFNTTANAFARQNVALANAVAELPRTLATATPAFNALNAAFPPVRTFARALDPGVVSAGPAIDTSLPFIHQLRQLVQPAELRGLTADLSVTVPALARLAQATIPLMRNQVRAASSCVANVIIPWSQLTLSEPNFSAKNGFPPHKVFQEALSFLPGLAGESRVFDANGPYIRVLGQGNLTYSLQQGLFGQALAPLSSVQPQPPPGWQRPPLQPTVPCETQAPITDLTAPTGIPLTQAARDTNLKAPGAAQRFQSATNALDALVQNLLKQGGSSVKVPGKYATAADIKSQGNGR